MIKPKNEGSSYLIDDALVKIEREQGMNRRTLVNADHEWSLPYARVDNPPDAPGYFTLKS